MVISKRQRCDVLVYKDISFLTSSKGTMIYMMFKTASNCALYTKNLDA